jgi:hypothetical protein
MHQSISRSPSRESTRRDANNDAAPRPRASDDWVDGARGPARSTFTNSRAGRERHSRKCGSAPSAWIRSARTRVSSSVGRISQPHACACGPDGKPRPLGVRGYVRSGRRVHAQADEHRDARGTGGGFRSSSALRRARGNVTEHGREVPASLSARDDHARTPAKNVAPASPCRGCLACDVRAAGACALLRAEHGREARSPRTTTRPRAASHPCTLP